MLWVKRNQKIYRDSYGREIVDDWLNEVDYFIRNIVFPELAEDLTKNKKEIKKMDYFFIDKYEKEIQKEKDMQAARKQFFNYFNKLCKKHLKKSSKINIPVQTGVDYELYVENTFVESGYTVTRTPATGDQGVDLILEKDGVRTAVQCKYYSKPVGNKAVQEVIAGKGFYQCEKAMVVSNAPFTKSARQLAENSGVELINIEC